MIEIREATEEDKPAIRDIIREVVAAGDAYAFAPDAPAEELLGFWCGPDKRTYVALWTEAPAAAGFLDDERGRADGRLVGTFFLKANQPGRGAHVANAGYMVADAARGRGVGRTMAEFSLGEARRLGFAAMQFNYVVKSNAAAVRLWQKLGFAIVGEVPDAFDHARDGLTNVYVMHRKL